MTKLTNTIKNEDQAGTTPRDCRTRLRCWDYIKKYAEENNLPFIDIGMPTLAPIDFAGIVSDPLDN